MVECENMVHTDRSAPWALRMVPMGSFDRTVPLPSVHAFVRLGIDGM